MLPLAIFGFSGVTSGLILIAGWLVALAISVVRYRNGTHSRQSLYRMAMLSFIWVADGLFAIATPFDGIAKFAFNLTGAVLIITGFAVGVRWWRSRGVGNNQTATS